MVFSLFKKSPQKMPERPAAKPRPQGGEATASREAATPVAEPREARTAAEAPLQVPAQAPGASESAPPKDLPDLDFTTPSAFDREFTESAVMAIEVEHDVDPVQVNIEQAAVLFANGQDSAARSILEYAARSSTGAEAERLWRMLLDLMQVLGDRAGFDKLGLEFVQTCETSPPAWREHAPVPVAAQVDESAVVLQGVLTGNDAPGLSKFGEALEAKQPLHVDFGRVAGCDDEAAGALCKLLQRARKQKIALALDGAEGLLGRLENRLTVGEQTHREAWLLVLELYQSLDMLQQFEDKAVDYAITFEVSPPSWEPLAAKKVVPPKPAALANPVVAEEVHYLTGEIKNSRFDDVAAYLELHDQPIIDMSRLKRLDFFSAGILRNLLEPCKRAGKEVVLRHPHHLVAELLGIIGVTELARVIVAKN